MLSLEQIRASLQERLALGLSWQADAAGLETRASGRKVWNLSWKPRKGNSEARLWVSADAFSGEVLDLHWGGPKAADQRQAAGCEEEEALAIATRTLAQVYPAKGRRSNG